MTLPMAWSAASFLLTGSAGSIVFSPAFGGLPLHVSILLRTVRRRVRAFLLAVFTINLALPVPLRRWSLLLLLRGRRMLRRRGKILRSAVALLKPVIQRLDVPISARLQRCSAWVLLHELLRYAFPTLRLLGP